MDEPSAGEHADRRRAAAEIDNRRAELGLVVDQRRQARGVRRRRHRLDLQMAAFDDQHEVARRRRIARGDMKVDAELGADHALGIAHVLGRVEPEGGRNRVQDRSSRLGVRASRSLEDPLHVLLADAFAVQRDVGAEAARGQAPARHIDDDAADLDARHALGRVNGQARGVLRRQEIDDLAALDAVRALMADAEHLASMGAPAQRLRRLHRRQAGDQANDLRGADVEHRQNGALARRDLAHARRERPEAHGWAPFLAAWLSAHASAASSDKRRNARPGTRKSTARMSRSRMRDWRSRRRSVAIAA